MTNSDLGSDTQLFVRLHRALVRGSSCTTVFLSADFVIRFVSASVKVLLGFDPQLLVGRFAPDLVHPDDMGELAEMMLHEELSPTSFEEAGHGRLALRTIRLATANGGWRALDLAAANLLDDEFVNGFVLHFVDAEIRSAELNAYRSLVDLTDPVDSLDAIAHFTSTRLEGALTMIEADGATNRLDGEQVARFRLLGMDRPDVLRVPVNVDGQQVGLLLACDPKGRPFSLWSLTLCEESAELVAKLVLRERSNKVLARAANTDALTGLANRHAFNSAIDKRRSRSDDRTIVALIYLDLDGFKQINDRLGHVAGDQVLVVVGERLSTIVRGADVVARMGGDEFCVLATVASSTAAQILGERIVHELSQPMLIDGTDIRIGATVGIAVASGSGVDIGLVKAADDLVIHMKGQRRGSVALTLLEAPV